MSVMRSGPATKTALAAVLLVAIAGVSACKRKEKPAAPQPPAPAASSAPVEVPASSAAPLSYQEKGGHAEVTLKLPEGLASEPDLHARLYAEGVRDLKQFAEGSSEETEEIQAQGESAMPYAREIDWSVAGETGKLMSLRKVAYESAGGAHPNTVYSALLWDRAIKKPVKPAALFKKGTDFSKLDRTLCDAARAAKKKKLGKDYQADSADTWTCPKWQDTAFVLTPSTVAGKAGGLTFLLSPYEIGSYAEGPYDITVPLSAFAGALSPAYADEFAGAPAAPAKTVAQK
jgi:hypothetical protein